MMKLAKDINIFIVDDDPMCRKLYSRCLHLLGCEQIQLFDNGQECINELVKQPDVVFVDYYMDGLNGLEVLKKIKRFDPDIFVVLISGQQDMQVAINSLKYGAFDYIIKGTDEAQRIKTATYKMLHVMGQLTLRKPRSRLARVFAMLPF